MRLRYRWVIGALLVGLAALALIASGAQDSLAVDGIVYVDADAGGANNGTSWDDAYTTLQPALSAASSGTGDQIWVAAGTYKPTAEHGGTGDRYRSFQLLKGVALYGGFDPGAGDIAWEDRDWVAHPTILSGDLDGNDGPNFENNDENSYHVFYHPEEYTDLDSSAILDGFTITGGNANGEYSTDHNSGGGIFNESSSPTVANCTFSGNSAFSGGGMYSSSSMPTVTNCIFSGNSVGGLGGGMLNASSSPAVTNCAFSDNSAFRGGGMCNQHSSALVTNCTFSGNSAYEGGGMANLYSDSMPVLTNCILWENGPDQIYTLYSQAVVTYSDVQGGYEGEGNIDENPLVVAPDNGDFHLHPCSPCIDAGDNDAPDLPLYDFEGDDRKVDGDGNGTAIVDIGVDEVAVVGTCLRVHLPVVLKAY